MATLAFLSNELNVCFHFFIGSQILAARAKFLWEREKDEEDETMVMLLLSSPHIIVVFSELICINCLMSYYLQTPGEEDGKGKIEPVADTGESDTEEYYKKMLKENPTDLLLLKNYAQFLCKVTLFCRVF